jgi:hypothetical protein
MKKLSLLIVVVMVASPFVWAGTENGTTKVDTPQYQATTIERTALVYRVDKANYQVTGTLVESQHLTVEIEDSITKEVVYSIHFDFKENSSTVTTRDILDQVFVDEGFEGRAEEMITKSVLKERKLPVVENAEDLRRMTLEAFNNWQSRSIVPEPEVCDKVLGDCPSIYAASCDWCWADPRCYAWKGMMCYVYDCAVAPMGIECECRNGYF